MPKYKIIPSSRTIVQSPISIGHKAEKGVEAIEFDLTAWVETYGSGTLTVIMRRWGDAIPYPIALEIDENNKATWTLSDIDTAKAGMAYAQLNYIVGDEVVKKSDIYTFRVMDSLTGEGDPPEAYESWLEHLTHFAAEAMAEVLDIEGIVTDKTLTVDGGIADGKATGDALALKADKSTTYTKTEVDQMIEDVEVETDTTLEVAGMAADAAETGRQIGLLKADLGDVSAETYNIWDESYVRGNINNQGVVAPSETLNRMASSFIEVDPNNTYFIASAYPVYIFLYDSNKSFLQMYGTSVANTYRRIGSINENARYIRMRIDTYPYNHDVCVALQGTYDGYIPHMTAHDIVSRRSIESAKTTFGEHLSFLSDVDRRLSLLDGSIYSYKDFFELGNVTISPGTPGSMLYSGSTTRMRLKEGIYMHLKVGDSVSLAGGVFYTGYYVDGTLKGLAWRGSLEVTEEGDYTFLLRYSTEGTITDADELVSGFSIKTAAEMLEALKSNRVVSTMQKYRYYDHMLLNTMNGSNVVIPLQSTASIDFARRLGFKVVEVNVKPTSDGKYIVTHGTNGAFGSLFEHVDGETDISATLINSVTLDWIKENVRFKSLYSKYRTAPNTLEEHLRIVKEFNLIPLVQIEGDSEVVAIADSIMGKGNYVAYNSNRSLSKGLILRTGDLTTKADILARCRTYGTPFIYFMMNPGSFTDEELEDIVDSLHSEGYMIGFQDTYVAEPNFARFIKHGFDCVAASWNINDIECGNLWNLTGDVTFDDFETTGAVREDGNLHLENGQYIRKWNVPQQFIVGIVIYIRFSGTLTVNMAGNTRSGTYTSDGTSYVRISCGNIRKNGTFMLTSSGDTIIYSLSGKASAM